MPRRSPKLAPDYQKQDVRDSIETLELRPMLPSFTVAAAQAIPTGGLERGMQIYVTNETGGAVPAFFDGTDWRRVTDRAVIS